MKTTIAATALFFLFMASPLLAATMIEIKSDNTLSRIYSDGKKARMEMDAGEDYTIIDPESGTAYTVMTSDKQVIKMTLTNEGVDTGAKVKVKMKKIGNGPKIVGYRTKKYDFYVNDQFCGSVFSSKKAMKDAQIEPIYTFIQSLTAKMQAFSSQLNMNNDPCMQGGVALAEQVMALGLALKSIEKDGSVSSEIVKIDKRAKLPANTFTVPQDYQVQDMDDMHKSMQQELHKQGVNMEDMMQQLQESGNMPPEMLEKMKQMPQRQ